MTIPDELLVLAPRAECDPAFGAWQVNQPTWRCATDTACNQWVEALLEAGICFPFDERQRLPVDLPANLAPYRAVLLPADRAAEFADGPAAAHLAAFRAAGGYVYTPAADVPPPHRLQGNMQRLILTAGLRQQHPAQLARLQAVPDETLLAWWRASLAEQARVLLAADAGWAWGDPVAYHLYWAAEAAAEVYGDEACREVIWECVRTGLDRRRWPHALCCGKRFALKYYQHSGDQAVLARVLADCADATLGVYAGRDWRLDGVLINADLKAPPGVDPDQPPPRVRDNAWVWPETAGNLGDSLGYLSRVTGDPRHAERAVRQVLTTHRWCFAADLGLWYHVGRPTGPDRLTAPWGRGNGWFLYGLRGLLEDLPASHPARPELAAALAAGFAGLRRWQRPDGLWHNVLDALPGSSRPDASATWMFLATLARAGYRGWLRDDALPEVCERAWRGLKSRLWRGLPIGHCDGTPSMASRQSYLSWPHTKFLGTAPLLARLELERLRAGR